MYVKVRVAAGVRKEKVTQIDDVTFEMFVKEPAERNLANKRIRTLLAEVYNVEKGKARIVTGHHSQSKIFNVLQETNK